LVLLSKTNIKAGHDLGKKNKPNTKLWLLLLLLAALSIPNVSAALQAGDPFPAMSGKTLDGGNFDLSSLEGKPVIIKLGTTWCGACQLQGKAINDLAEYLKTNDIHFVDVYIQESASTVRNYFNQDGRPLPETVILDDGEIGRKLNVYLIPRVILLNSEHKVFLDGSIISNSNLEEQLRAMLAN